MTDFLLELRSEEIPARMQAKARDDLARLFTAELAEDGLIAAETVTYATPRRLALIARGLPDETEAVRHEMKGPRVGAPDQAIEGFLRRYQLSREQLIEREGVYFAERFAAGRPTWRVLGDAIEDVIRGFPWPKSMRWGAASLSSDSLRWVRPLHGIVALFGERIVECEAAGIRSGATTLGHRFNHPGEIRIGSVADYFEKLRACHVIVDQDERAAIIRDRARALAAEAGLALIDDEALLAENAGLTEWPVPLLGRFDPAFLAVPREVIQLTMRTNQRYFACVGDDGALASAFVCTANIKASDGGAAIVAGNAKVLAARLADARFFWEQDLRVPLDVQAEKLAGIVFHEKLGTVADKVERVAKLARWLVESDVVTPAQAGVSGGERNGSPQAIPASAGMTKERLADMAERAARLAKADLVTGMVGEFPELQGVMGGYYATAQGEPPEVADAIRDHYKPVGQGDEVPTAPVTVAVSLADKLDTLAGFYGNRDLPTGSKDPYALRRATLGFVAIAVVNGLRFSLDSVFDRALDEHEEAVVFRNVLAQTGQMMAKTQPTWEQSERNYISLGRWRAKADFIGFAADRLKVQQREAGVRHDLIDAVFALGGEDDLVRLLARVKALQAFVETEDGANLLAGYRRAANILRAEAKTDGAAPPPFAGFAYAPEPAEDQLAVTLDAQLPLAQAAIEAEDFAAAMTALSVIRPAIDAFFDDVTVNAQDAIKRATRLGLLDKLRAAMHRVADFSRIEG